MTNYYNDLMYLSGERPQYMMCCICGITTDINPSRMCINCIRSEVDITEGISRQVILPYCKHCRRFQKPPWISCELESRELLALCLKKIRGLNNVRLIDASFIWTEPHSRRLKVRCVIQKEVMNGAIMQQTIIVEFYMQGQQCDDCKRSFTPHIWNSVVQIRQKVPHKRTFLYLEQLILKHGAHEKVSNIVEKTDGLDFQFQQKTHAQKLVDFVIHYFISKVKTSRQLISHDSHSNTHHNKFTFSVELCPVCRDDLIFIPKHLCTNLFGGISSFVLCSKISSRMYLLDPFTGKEAELANEKYWQYAGLSTNNIGAFAIILNKLHLVDFYVLNVEKDLTQLCGNKKIVMAEVEVCKPNDLGQVDSTVIVKTHLGGILHPGDWVSGYDLRTLNNIGELENIKEFQQWLNANHDVILVRRTYAKDLESKYQSISRPWVLQRLPREIDENNLDKKYYQDNMNNDIENFKREIETDIEMRKEINLYWDPRSNIGIREQFYQKARKPRYLIKKKKNNETYYEKMIDDTIIENVTECDIDDYIPQVDISELLDGLTLDDEIL
ncbi:NMD3 family protein [Cryptosporidium muris RN66]|uniref:60S ribosomal export protein NMD3 n=1 Tax=Cryptosporidium muris (strain RN66) TaxID=441375 RepID=B6AAI2_CRYMR|nr:NMD3 family protein [Cryptosporidium muris RN66]EEA05223.1 NMD3 family protein [Cryptosporidium muris RN66]|eukprot:XP_002139572.1 NMD3 family protein [Cryptosporidium muris RN66]